MTGRFCISGLVLPIKMLYVAGRPLPFTYNRKEVMEMVLLREFVTDAPAISDASPTTEYSSNESAE